jgi:hypothetical protein
MFFISIIGLVSIDCSEGSSDRGRVCKRGSSLENRHPWDSLPADRGGAMLKKFAVGLIVTVPMIGSIFTQRGWDGSRIGSTVTPFLSTSAQRQVAPWNTDQGAANSLLPMPESGRARIEMQHKPEPAPSLLPLKLHDQYENPGTYRIAASEDTAGQSAVTPRIPETVAIRYVANGGSDANDGLSWGTAKHTIYGALVSLPGGGTNTAGSGTVYVGPASSANPTAGAGIWLMASSDPNYSSPPMGWLKCNGCELNIIGVANSAGGPNGHKPRVQLVAGRGTDNYHPAIWLSGLQQPTQIANFELQYPGRAVVIGECSPVGSKHDRTGRCGVSSQILDNIGAIINRTATTGPCTDIVSNVFWLWMRDYGCAGNAYTAKGGITADNAAAILIDASAGAGSGLIYIEDTNLASGGIKVNFGANGGGLYAKNVIQEGDFSSPLPPTVWFTSWCSYCDAILENIQMADGSSGSMPLIQTDALANGNNGPTIINSGSTKGPATIINPVTNNTNIRTISPTREGQSGFFNSYVVGRTDVARRIAGLIPTRFTNHALSSTSSWIFPQGSTGVSFTQGLTDPYGGTNAASVAFSSSSQQVVQMGGLAYTPNAGDWVVLGVWGKGLAQNNSLNTNCWGQPVPTFSESFLNSGMIVGDGNWQYLWVAEKVASGSATYVCADVNFTNKVTPTLYGPTLYVIPAGTLSDNEVLEFVSSMNSVDSSCQVGQICNVAGHPLVVSSYGTLSNCSSVASPARCDSAPAGSFVLRVGSMTARVNTRAVTANSQILIIEDSSLGAKLGVSCNKTAGRTYMITDRAPGLSFTVSSSSAPTDNPACLSFQVLN